MNTILSIDLDILFAPYIGIYNRLIKNGYNCQQIWDGVEQEYTITDFIPNLDYCKVILNILQYYTLKINKVYIGQDHSSILTALELEKAQFQLPYIFNLYNIDFHHDIGYGDQNLIKDIKNGRVNCGSWVGYLNYYNFLNTYYWYDGIGSQFDNYRLSNDLNELLPKNLNRQLLNDNFPMDLNIDLLYITFSPPWIPPQYYDVIKEILKLIDKNKIKYLPNAYQEGNLKKPFLSLEGEKGYEVFNFLN